MIEWNYLVFLIPHDDGKSISTGGLNSSNCWHQKALTELRICIGRILIQSHGAVERPNGCLFSSYPRSSMTDVHARTNVNPCHAVLVVNESLKNFGIKYTEELVHFLKHLELLN